MESFQGRSVVTENRKAWQQIVAIMALRLAVISGFIVVLALLLPGDKLAFFAFMAFAYIATIPYALWLKNRALTLKHMPVQFLVDLLWVTGLVYFTGGINSPLALLYPLVILAAGIVAGPRQAFLFTTLSILCYFLIVVLMVQGVLLPYAAPGYPMKWPELLETMVLRLLIFVCFGVAGAYVSSQCHYAARRVEQFREVAELIFRNVKAGLVLMDAGGGILMVNEKACELLEQEEQKLVGQPISLLIEGEHELERSSGRSTPSPCYFRRSNGTAFPAGYEISHFDIPADALPDGPHDHRMMTVSLMVFSDIGRLVEMQEEAKFVGRMRAAAQMAAEIAHQIRNPLAAVSGAVQLLNKLERNVAAGIDGSKDLLDKERSALYKQVIKESSRLDRIIEEFIDYAEGSPEALTALQRHTRDLGIREEESSARAQQKEFSWNK